MLIKDEPAGYYFSTLRWWKKIMSNERKGTIQPAQLIPVCWWPGNARIQVNNIHGIDLSWNIPVSATEVSTGPDMLDTGAGLVLGLRPANERRRYKVTWSLIGWTQTKIHHCGAVWTPSGTHHSSPCSCPQTAGCFSWGSQSLYSTWPWGRPHSGPCQSKPPHQCWTSPLPTTHQHPPGERTRTQAPGNYKEWASV